MQTSTERSFVYVDSSGESRRSQCDVRGRRHVASRSGPSSRSNQCSRRRAVRVLDASARRDEHALELAERDLLLLLVARDGVGARPRARPRAPRRASISSSRSSLKSAERRARARRALRARAYSGSTASRACADAQRQLLALERHACAEQRVLELVLALRELGGDDARPRTSCAAGRAAPARRRTPRPRLAQRLDLRRGRRAPRSARRSRPARRSPSRPPAPRGPPRSARRVPLEPRLVLGGGANGCGRHRSSESSVRASREFPTVASRSLELERLPRERRRVDRPRVRSSSAEPVTTATGSRGSRRRTRPAARRPARRPMWTSSTTTSTLPLERARAARERRRLEHPVTLELEIHPAEQPNRRLVVDDEHGRRSPTPSREATSGRTRSRAWIRFHFVNGKRAEQRGADAGRGQGRAARDCPTRPRRSGAARGCVFQRALDPLAPPKPLPMRARGGAEPASVVSRPSSSMLSNRPGETFEPVTATRIGWNACRGFSPSRPRRRAAPPRSPRR